MSSAEDGYVAQYEREVPIELRSADASDQPSEIGALEAIRVKLMLKGELTRPVGLRVELSSETNLFFHYTHTMDERGFVSLQEDQNLMVPFPDYYSVILRMLNACIKQPHKQLAVFIMKADGTARLDFIQVCTLCRENIKCVQLYVRMHTHIYLCIPICMYFIDADSL